MRLGIFGYPARHSLSPRMHQAALAAVGLSGWSYEILEVSPEAFGQALGSLRHGGWRGANVTIPYKESAMAQMDHLTDDARSIGAVNTIVVDQGKLCGHNTDAPGFLDVVGDVRGARCAILGAGGSARAIVYALRLGKAKEIRVISRRQLSLPGADRAEAWSSAALADVDWVIGCVPPEVEPPPLERVPSSARVIDLVYYAQSRLLQAAQAHGLRTDDGLEMLIRQGARAFQLWTGKPAPLEIMREAIRKP